MPAAETLERFIARVEQNAHAEALEEFYSADSSMQEHQSAPRVGRDANVANERHVLTSECVRPVFVSGDRYAGGRDPPAGRRKPLGPTRSRRLGYI